MITRYSRPEMRAIWTDENKLRLWLQIELLASEALAAGGVVPKADFAKIKAGAEQWLTDLPGLVARQRELEKTLNHDVIALRRATSWTPPLASKWFKARTS
jgi:adenylosuccinate lyase